MREAGTDERITHERMLIPLELRQDTRYLPVEAKGRAMFFDLMLRLRSLFHRRAVERELDEELRYHLEQQTAKYVRQGLSTGEAARLARIALGGLEQTKEAHRDARGLRLIDDLGRDLRYTARQIRRAPGFALLAMICLGLGIGANVALFGVINAVALRRMPVHNPDRLVAISRGRSASVSYPAYRDFQARTRVLAGLTATLPMESDLDVEGDSEFVTAEAAAANYAEVMGLRLAAGRWFADDRETAAVISYAVWERKFELSPQVIGRLIRSESQSYTIVGVAPREFAGVFAPLRTDVWVPIQTRPNLTPQLEAGRLTLMLFGRLRDGAEAAHAAAELNAIDLQLQARAKNPAIPSSSMPSAESRPTARADCSNA
jgi:hypothetical protein